LTAKRYIERLVELGIKRGIDAASSAVGLLLLTPLLLVVAAAIRMTSPGPAIFRHQRLGKNGVPYTVYKFRTMYEDAEGRTQRDAQGATVIPEVDPRVTPLGRFLRSWSLDELPQLWNVLRGDMSLVGPRPDELLAIGLYNERERLRLCMRPGLTGLAVVNGRNQIPWRERIEWDVRYVETFSLELDLSILLRTVKVILGREGIYTSAKESKDGSEQSSSEWRGRHVSDSRR
jgi:lipopolysaccharide/colanic/teichoic acid biosynthesis glycosyltransferase